MSLRRRFTTWVGLAAFLIGVAATTFASTYDFSYSGRLVDKEGKPLAGPVALKMSFYHSEFATSAVLDVTTGIDNVQLKDGVFQVVLSLEGSDFQRVFPNVSQAVYVEVTDLTNAASAPYGRQRLTILPYAGKVPVDSSQFAWSSDGKLQLVGGSNADATAVATLTNKTIDAASNTVTNISNSSISATAAIADSKLATISTAGKVSGAAITSGIIAGSTAVSTSGSIATTGKVGVGTVAGTSQMEVKGGGASSATSSLNVMDSAGTSKLFVRDDGNVGIGTTSPGQKLHILGASHTAARIESGNDTFAGFQFYDGVAGNSWAIGNASHLSDAFVFSYGNVGGESELVRISKTGNVGIGTAAPTNTETVNRVLDVWGSNSSKVVATTSSVQTGIWSANSADILRSGNLAGGIAGTFSNHPYQVVTNGYLRMLTATDGSTTSYGNFTAGTSTSGAVSYQSAPNGWRDGFVMKRAGSDVGGLGVASNNTDINLFTANTERVTVTSTGNVGIGTTSPNNMLEINGGALSFYNPSGPWVAVGMDYDATADSGQGQFRLRSNNAAGNLNQTNLVINRIGGNVGIGTTTLTSPLDSTAGYTGFGASNTGATKLVIRESTKDLAHLALNGPTGSGGGLITGAEHPGDTGHAIYLRRGIDGESNKVDIVEQWGAVRLWTGASGIASERMRIDTSGNVGIGTTTPQAKLHVEAGAICVSSGAGSNDCSSAANTAGTIFAVNTTVQGADYAEYFSSEDILASGDLVGLNSQSNLVRRYQAGDKLVGVASTKPGVVGNSKLKGENAVLVALMGQVPFSRSDTRIDGNVVTTTDGIQVGYLLASGDLYLQMSSVDKKLSELKSENDEGVDRVKAKLFQLKAEKDAEVTELRSAVCQLKPDSSFCAERSDH